MDDRFTLRYMTVDDLPQVVEVDKRSFPIPWSVRTYEYEILRNANSKMLVLTAPNAVPPPPNGAAPAATGVREWLHRLAAGVDATPSGPPPGEVVVGMGGFWCAVGEAHISTIAVHPDWRGRKLGEALLSAMLAHGIALGAVEAVLEVRVSNDVAINLYRKYGFEIVGRRPHYYHDNREDAWLMAVSQMDAAYQARLARLRRALVARVPLVDKVNGAPSAPAP